MAAATVVGVSHALADSAVFLVSTMFFLWLVGHSRSSIQHVPLVGPFARWVRLEVGSYGGLVLVVLRYLLRVYAEAGTSDALINVNAVGGLVLGAVLWWLTRNDPDDDDRWKRRRRRLSQVVRGAAGRLVVAPAR